MKKSIQRLRGCGMWGLDVRAMVSPTTKRGRECLRVVLHSFNGENEIDKLVEVLR